MLDAQSCRLINNDFILLRADTRDTDFIAFNGRGIIFHPRRVAACETVLLSVNRGIVITATMLSIKRNNPCYTLRRQPWLNVVKLYNNDYKSTSPLIIIKIL